MRIIRVGGDRQQESISKKLKKRKQHTWTSTLKDGETLYEHREDDYVAPG